MSLNKSVIAKLFQVKMKANTFCIVNKESGICKQEKSHSDKNKGSSHFYFLLNLKEIYASCILEEGHIDILKITPSLLQR